MPRFALTLVPLLALLLFACQPSLRQQPTIDWVDLQRGKSLAAERQMPVLVDYFYGARCQRCDKMCVLVYEDPATAARVVREFVPVRVDLRYPLSGAEQALMGELGNNGECVLAVLTPDGKVLTTEEGQPLATMAELTVAEFNAYLDQARERLRTLTAR